MQGPKWQFLLILIVYGPCVAILNCLGQVLYLGRAPHTKETLPDFREWCQVTRHPRVFRGLTGSQWTPRVWGVTYIGNISVIYRKIRNIAYKSRLPSHNKKMQISSNFNS